MARKHEHQGRVDQLHADLRRIGREHSRRAGTPLAGPLFHVDQDGTVRDQQGNKVYEPPPAKP